MKFPLVLAALLGLFSMESRALEVMVGYVTLVQPGYMPSTVSFIMDASTASCPAGAWLSWQNADASNNRAVLASLLAAMAAKQKVRFHVNDGDTTCKGQFIHVPD